METNTKAEWAVIAEVAVNPIVLLTAARAALLANEHDYFVILIDRINQVTTDFVDPITAWTNIMQESRNERLGVRQ